MTDSPTILIGLDGASWPLILEELDTEKLPTLRDILSTGISSTSKSHLPPVTCPNWRCMSSGKNPGQLGVYWWERIDIEHGDISLNKSEDFKTADIWDYLADNEVDVGVVNMPLTYPPDNSIHPFISGGPDCDSEGYASTEDLEKELENELNYRVHSQTAPTDAKHRIKEDVLELIDRRFEASKYLYKKYGLDFLYTVIYYLVRLEHYYWNGQPVQEAWELIDEHLQWFRDQGFNIIIASDHGCTKIDTVFNINQYLKESGYLRLANNRANLLGKAASLGINTETLADILGQLHLRQTVSSIVPDRLIDKLPQSPGGASGTNKQTVVDWERTGAIGSGQGPIYLKNSVDRNKISKELENLKDNANRPIVEEVHYIEDIYPKAEDDQLAPDIIVEQRKGVHTTDSVGAGKIIQAASERDKWRAENESSGIFAAAGPDIRNGWNRDAISISDIAPSLLHFLDQPVPKDMSGDVFQMRKQKQSIETRSPILSSTQKGDKDMEMQDRLRNLGYLE